MLDIINNQIQQAKELIESLEEEHRKVLSYDMAAFLNSCESRIERFWETTNDILLVDENNNGKLIELWSRYNKATPSLVPFKEYIDKLNRMIGTLENMKSLVNNSVKNNTNTGMKKQLLFISHASANKSFVDALVELLTFLKFDTTNLFCSSTPGYGIPVGQDIYDFLRSRFVDFDIFVIFVHSKEFYQSHACLNEMGAAWAFQSKHVSILLPGFDFADMDGAVNNKNIAIKIDDKLAWNGVNSLKDQLISFFSLVTPNDSAWEDARNRFFDRIKS